MHVCVHVHVRVYHVQHIHVHTHTHTWVGCRLQQGSEGLTNPKQSATQPAGDLTGTTGREGGETLTPAAVPERGNQVPS